MTEKRFHIGGEECNTVTESNVRRILSLLTGKPPSDSKIDEAIAQIVGQPDACHTFGVLRLQYRPSL